MNATTAGVANTATLTTTSGSTSDAGSLPVSTTNTTTTTTIHMTTLVTAETNATRASADTANTSLTTTSLLAHTSTQNISGTLATTQQTSTSSPLITGNATTKAAYATTYKTTQEDLSATVDGLVGNYCALVFSFSIGSRAHSRRLVVPSNASITKTAPATLPINQATSRRTNHSTNHSIDQATNQPTIPSAIPLSPSNITTQWAWDHVDMIGWSLAQTLEVSPLSTYISNVTAAGPSAITLHCLVLVFPGQTVASLERRVDRFMNGSRWDSEAATFVGHVVQQLLLAGESAAVALDLDPASIRAQMPVEVVRSIAPPRSVWVAGPWGFCPDSCGGALAYREVDCSSGNLAACSLFGPEPSKSMNCQATLSGAVCNPSYIVISVVMPALAILLTTAGVLYISGWRHCLLKGPTGGSGKVADFDGIAPTQEVPQKAAEKYAEADVVDGGSSGGSHNLSDKASGSSFKTSVPQTPPVVLAGWQSATWNTQHLDLMDKRARPGTPAPSGAEFHDIGLGGLSTSLGSTEILGRLGDLEAGGGSHATPQPQVHSAATPAPARSAHVLQLPRATAQPFRPAWKEPRVTMAMRIAEARRVARAQGPGSPRPGQQTTRA